MAGTSGDGAQAFAGRRAFVTGAGAGIGRAIAGRLAAEGAAVACVDLDAEAAAATADGLRTEGATAEAIEADVSSPESVEAAVAATVETLGGLDLLVNNAGIVVIKAFDETSLEEWDRTNAVNLRALFLTCRTALPHLRAAPRASIVNIASMAAFRFTVPHIPYAATKAGVVAFTRDLAFELGPDRIRVNAVAPGPIATDMLAGEGGEAFDRIGSSFLLGRIGRPEDIAEAVAFLASERASYVTGETLRVTGGAELATRALRPVDA